MQSLENALSSKTITYIQVSKMSRQSSPKQVHIQTTNTHAMYMYTMTEAITNTTRDGFGVCITINGDKGLKSDRELLIRDNGWRD